MAMLRNLRMLLDDRTYMERTHRLEEIAESCGYGVYVTGGDGTKLPVYPPLKEFADKLLQAMPGIKFWPSNTEWAGSMQVVRELSVFVDEYPFDIGRIGYGDWSVKQDGKTTEYGVYSRKIENKKYRENSQLANMVITGKLDVAVKNACKYLVPFSHKELAKTYYDHFCVAVQRESRSYRDKLNSLVEPLHNNAVLAKELEFLVKQGVQFITPEFREASTKILAALEEANTEATRKTTGVFVRIKDVCGEQYADILEATDIKNSYKMTAGEVTTCSIDELPQDIAESVSVLSILSPSQYAPRVGQRVEETIFWVERG